SVKKTANIKHIKPIKIFTLKQLCKFDETALVPKLFSILFRVNHPSFLVFAFHSESIAMHLAHFNKIHVAGFAAADIPSCASLLLLEGYSFLATPRKSPKLGP
ncbi:hypothetical protein ACJX0J_039580, partial [Zea mays]